MTSNGEASVIHAPAKVNVVLLVAGRRADGYHDVATLLAPLTLADELTVARKASAGVGLTVEGADLPADERNLAYRAAAAYLAAAGGRRGLAVKLVQHIPVGAGLGGGSSDAAAVLAAANRLGGSPLGADALWRLARDLGADVAFFLQGRWAVAAGRGEVVTPTRGPAGVRFLLAAPATAVSTAAVYGAVTPAAYADDALPLWDTLSRLDEPPAVWWPRGVNSLEPAAVRLYPALGELKTALAELGFGDARLSGSGGAYAAPAPGARRAAAAVRGLQRRGYWATVTTTA